MLTPTDPLWVIAIRRYRIAEDIGVGDTAQRYFAMLGGEQFKQWAENMGIPCGCAKRQEEWNRLWPY